MLRLAAYSRETAVGRLFRRKDVSDIIAKYPYIDSLKIVRRRYLATPTKWRIGYQVDMSVQDRLGPASSYEPTTFYVSGDGRDIPLF